MAKILVAEDDKFLSEAYKTKLSSSGFEVKIVVDGEEALREITGFDPDLVILDLKMPRYDGFYFLEGLRGNGHPSRPPVVVASNSGDKNDVARAMSLGAADYVVKSNLSMTGLIEKINGILQLHNTPPGSPPTS